MKTPSADRIVLIGRVIFLSTLFLSTSIFAAAFGIARLYGAEEGACMCIGVVVWFFSVPFIMALAKQQWIKWAIKKVSDIFELQKALERANLLFLFQKYLQQYKELNAIQPKMFSDFTDDHSVPPQTVIYYRNRLWLFTFWLCLVIAGGAIKHVIGSPHSVGLYFPPAVMLLATCMSFFGIKDTSKTLTLSNDGITIGDNLYMWSWIAGYKVSWHPLPQLIFLYNSKRYLISLEQIAVRHQKIDHLLAVYYGRAMKDVKYSICNSEYDGKHFLIQEEHQTIGTYLFVFDGNICTHDYLQDNVNMCKEFALEEFNVPIDSWSCNEL